VVEEMSGYCKTDQLLALHLLLDFIRVCGPLRLAQGTFSEVEVPLLIDEVILSLSKDDVLPNLSYGALRQAQGASFDLGGCESIKQVILSQSKDDFYSRLDCISLEKTDLHN
jgi:hypothetical protein